jgi:pheromone shutdown protein TraB
MFYRDHDEITCILSVVGVYSLVVCLCYASVTRQFSTEELVVWIVFNAGFSMASVMLGYATV